ncbi:MAG: ABC transporter substrate-binding protein, partial [Chloroflexota bacterium]|nr:ABC transporter substrate-binding protein [Chloroflexota bacterium]
RAVAARPAAQEPAQGGTILIGTLGEAQSINPLLTNETEGQWRTKMMFDQFVNLNLETLQPEPGLAREWTISEDGLSYTFVLQDGVTFSDGTPLTTADVEFTLRGMLTKEVASPYVSDFLGIAGAREFNEGTAQAISGVEVVDPRTIRMTLASPNAAFLTVLRWLRPLPKHLLDGKNLTDDPFFQAPIGAGPFKFVSWSTGQDFVAARNETYWQQGKPHLDGFTHRVTPDAQTIVIALQTAQIEGSEYALATQASQLETVENLSVLVKPQGVDVNGWNFGQKTSEVLRDARVRRAIAMAIDTQTFASDFLLGLGTPAVGPIPPGSWAYDDTLEPIPYDPEGARALLQEAGASEMTLRTTVNAGNQFREDWVTYTQQSLAEIGVTVEPDIKEWTQVVKDGTEGTFEAISPTFAGVLVDPDELYGTLHTGEQQNVSGYSNPEFDRLLEQGRAATDLEERKRVYSEAQKILLQDVPVFYAWDRPFISVTTDDFTGYTNTILSFFDRLEEWQRTG